MRSSHKPQPFRSIQENIAYWLLTSIISDSSCPGLLAGPGVIPSRLLVNIYICTWFIFGTPKIAVRRTMSLSTVPLRISIRNAIIGFTACISGPSLADDRTFRLKQSAVSSPPQTNTNRSRLPFSSVGRHGDGNVSNSVRERALNSFKKGHFRCCR